MMQAYAQALSSLRDPQHPLPRKDPELATVRHAMSAVIGVQIARSYAAVIHALEGHPGLVIKCPARTGEANLLHKEAKRLSQLPNIATVNFIPIVEGTRALMERLLPMDIQDLKAPHLERLRSDMVSALQTLHGCGIVHADIHRHNIMIRKDPPSFVLIDLGGTAGESIYPLALGYGAIGEGGTRHRTPHEQGPLPIRTAKGDYFRLAITLRHEILDIVHVKTHRHFKVELDLWIKAGSDPLPPWPSSAFPGGSWLDSAVQAQILVQAGLWSRDGAVCRSETVFFHPADRRGNDDGAFVVEQAAGSSSQAAGRAASSGSWEQSAVYAKFYLSCGLRTRGARVRPVFFEVFPFLRYSNQNGYLQIEVPPPPPETAGTAAEPATTVEMTPRLPSRVVALPLTGVWAEPAQEDAVNMNMESMD